MLSEHSGRRKRNDHINTRANGDILCSAFMQEVLEGKKFAGGKGASSHAVVHFLSISLYRPPP
jgi:hypothetical protein